MTSRAMYHGAMTCACGAPGRVTAGGTTYCWSHLPQAATATVPAAVTQTCGQNCGRAACWKVAYDDRSEKFVCDEHMATEFASAGAISAEKIAN